MEMKPTMSDADYPELADQGSSPEAETGAREATGLLAHLTELRSRLIRALAKEAAEIRKLNPMNEFTEPADRSESDRTGRT